MWRMTDELNNDPKNAGRVGLRYNSDKPRCELFPSDAMLALADVYGKGAEKYDDNNWRRGMRYGICIGAAMRHIFAWMRGENCDQETGCHHLAMAAWNCLAIVQWQHDDVGADDRWVDLTPTLPIVDSDPAEWMPGGRRTTD